VDPREASSRRALEEVLVPSDACRQLVAAFYTDEGPFSGNTFLSLQPNERNVIGPADLLAVTTMDEAYSVRAVRELLDGVAGNAATDYLKDISTELDLWNATDLSAAVGLWRLLDSLPSVGPTKASKLMARKRPRLIPVYDSIVGSNIATADRYWDVFKEFLVDDDNRDAIDEMRPAEVSAEDLPTLRILDTLIWMRHSKSRNAKRARAQAGL
jgi:hypothetical protein